MKYALLILEDKTRGRESKLTVQNTVHQVEVAIKGTQQVQILNEGTLLFPLEQGLHALGTCVYEAKKHGLHSRTLFFDQEPSWVISK